MDLANIFSAFASIISLFSFVNERISHARVTNTEYLPAAEPIYFKVCNGRDVCIAEGKERRRNIFRYL